MARLIGKGHGEVIGSAERFMYKFVMKELPDYISASFRPRVVSASNDSVFECDMLLFIPHMGVYILDIRSATEFRYEGGVYYYGHGGMGFSSENRENRLLVQRYRIRHYLKETFNITPLVYELECFPFLSTSRLDLNMLPPGFDVKHVITMDDLENSLTFLHKILGCSIYMQEKMGTDVFEDLTDKDAHDLFYFWETGVLGAERPDRPPLVFLSYNRNNAQISSEIQSALEDRGVYTWRAPKDIPLGEDYFPEEMRAIEESDAFVILLSIAAQNSEEVRKEFDKALEIGKPILPIWVDEVPESEIAPYYREHLAKYQYRVMPKIKEEIIEEVVAKVKKIHVSADKAGRKGI